MNVITRLVLSAVSAIGTGLATAVMVAMVDLYLTGQGLGSLTREVITWEEFGVHLSPGDLVVLLAASIVAAIAWRVSGRASGDG